jgi:hypothetical protein
MFHAVGLKAIEAKERYKEGCEKSTCFNRADMVVYAVWEGRRKRFADVAAGGSGVLVLPRLGQHEVPRVKQVEIHGSENALVFPRLLTPLNFCTCLDMAQSRFAVTHSRPMTRRAKIVV